MHTVIEKITGQEIIDKKIFEKAKEILRTGGLVAFPTETVYGLGADALNAEAAKKIYAAKGRPSDNPLIVHIAEISALTRLAIDIPDLAYKLAERFWPGPLTIILKKSEIVPMSTTGGLETVAIRMPAHKTAKELIKQSGIYIAAPSANLSGKPSPTKGEHVEKDMFGRIPMIIEDDTVDIGVESTIVDLTENFPTILRPGFITKKMLEEAIGEVRVDPAILLNSQITARPKAPGMKYKHYAPEAEIKILEGDPKNVYNSINELVKIDEENNIKTAVLCSNETAHNYKCKIIVTLGSRDDEAELARNLFAILRDFDNRGIEKVYSESFASDNLGEAVMNRLLKAAGGNICTIR